jgi:hypothetical protein
MLDYFKTGNGAQYRSWIALYFIVLAAILGAFVIGLEVVSK